MKKLRYPEWQQPYEAALLEFDPTKLQELVTAAETAIFVRLQALSASPVGHEERQAIADATSALFTIKREILKFPGHDFKAPKEAKESSAS
jgi:hypothetical protein